MNLNVINCFLAEYVRPEPGSKFTALGIPLIVYLQDVTKPCYPLFTYIQIQAEGSGKAKLTFRIEDVRNKKSIVSFDNEVDFPAQNSASEGKEVYNGVISRPLGKTVFERPGEFTVAVLVNNKVVKSYEIMVAEVKTEKGAEKDTLPVPREINSSQLNASREKFDRGQHKNKLN